MKKSLKMLISSAMVAVMTMTSVTVPNLMLFGTTVMAAEASVDLGQTGYESGASLDGVSFANGAITLHGAFTARNANDHGVNVGNGAYITIDVTGPTQIDLGLCQYGNAGTYTLYNGETAVGEPIGSTGKACGAVGTLVYDGEEAATLTVKYEGNGGYLHSIAVSDYVYDPGLSEAVAGATDTLTFDATKSGSIGKLYSTNRTVRYMGSGSYHSYGSALKAGDTFEINVAGNATITFTGTSPNYSKAPQTFTVTSSADAGYSKSASTVGETEKGSVSFDYVGAATTLKFTVDSGTTYLGGVTVENAAAPVGVAKTFEFWLDDVAKGEGTEVFVAPGEYTSEDWGDSKITLFAKTDENFKSINDNYKNITRAGKTCNAYRGGVRYNNTFSALPKQGDGSSLLFQPVADGMATVYVYCNPAKYFRIHDFDGDGKFLKYTDTETGPESYSISVKAGHQYLFAPCSSDDLGFAGLEYIVSEPITVTASYSSTGLELGSAAITLIDTATGEEAGQFKAGTDSLILNKNHTYKLVSSDAAKKPLIDGKETFKATSENIEINIEEVADVTLTGKIVSDDADFDVSKITEIKFTSMNDSSVSYSTTNIDAEGNYTVTMKPGEFNTSVVSAEGYETKDRVSVSTDASANVNNIYIEPLGFTSASYGAADLEALVGVTTDKYVTLNNFSKHGGGHGPTAGNGATISIKLPAAAAVRVMVSYQGSFTITGKGETVSAATETNGSTAEATYTAPSAETVTVTINGTSYVKEINITPINDVAFTSSIDVPGDYATLKDAITAIKSMDRPAGEAGRVTINLKADLQEQVLVDVPYVTFDGGDDKHEINWYYGMAGKYYSVDSNGYFNRTLFMDKYSKKNGAEALWGGVVIVTGDYFKAKNVVFRNTFNYEVTDMEIEDGAEQSGALRTKDTKVQEYAYKERSNALYTNANYIEIVDCDILSSQDTLGVNGERNTVAYFKNCTIGGNVDYICGSGAMVFDECKLQWKTFSDKNNDKIGYICAPKSKPYVFRNCTVTKDDESKAVVGKYGRTWAGGSNATFYKTETNGMIDLVSWGEMNANDLNSATFYECENTNNGEAFNSTGRQKKDGSVSDVAAQDIPEALHASYTTDKIVADVLKAWIPDSYVFSNHGDVNGDGVVDNLDAKAIIQLVASISGTYDTVQADYDRNGEINLLDSIKLLDDLSAEQA